MRAGVHLVVEDRVDHGAEVELQLVQPQAQVAPAEALVEHHLLGVDGPALGEGARGEDLADQRGAAVAVLELDVVARDRPRGSSGS